MESATQKEVDQNVQIDSSHSKMFDEQELNEASPDKDEQMDHDSDDEEGGDTGANKYVEEHKEISEDDYVKKEELPKVARPTTKPLDRGRRREV